MLKFRVSTFSFHKSFKNSFIFFNVEKLTSFAVEQFGHADKENISDRMDKSINLNPVGNINSFGSSIYSTLSVEIIEGSINLFTFVRSWLVSTSSSIIASSTTKSFEVIYLPLLGFFLFLEYLLLLICFVQRSESSWALIFFDLSIFNEDLQILQWHSHRITTLQLATKMAFVVSLYFSAKYELRLFNVKYRPRLQT